MVGLSFLVTSTASASPRWAPAATAAIGPGAQLLIPVTPRSSNVCTAGFVFTAGGATFLGMAAHCAGTGSRDARSGCAEPTLPVGTTVLVRRNGGVTSHATLAYSSWVTMQQLGERDPQRCEFNDFALVTLSAADAAVVNPTVPLLGGPNGLNVDGVASGAAVYSYQPSDGATPVKEGTSLGDGAAGQIHYVATEPPGIPGDSGSGFLDSRGAAFGVLSTEFGDAQHSNGVSDLAAALGYADRYGNLGPITLVPGTAPFTGARE